MRGRGGAAAGARDAASTAPAAEGTDHVDSRTAIGRAARIAARMAARGVVAVQQRAAARAATGSGD